MAHNFDTTELIHNLTGLIKRDVVSDAFKRGKQRATQLLNRRDKEEREWTEAIAPENKWLIEDYYSKVAWDTEERQQKILEEGLTGLVQYNEDWEWTPDDPFYSLRIEPVYNKWTPLGNTNHNIKRITGNPDVMPYHISLGNLSNYKKPEHEHKWQHLMTLQRKYHDPIEHTFKIQGFGAGQTANLHPYDEVYQDVEQADATGKGIIHISML